MNAMRFTRSAPSLRTLGNPSPADAPWRDLPHVAVEICLENVEGARERVLGWSGDASFGRLSSS